MQYFILHETTENSGSYVGTGEAVDTLDDAVALCVARQAAGAGRFAIQPYEPFRQATAPQSAPSAQPAAPSPTSAPEEQPAPAPQTTAEQPPAPAQ